MSTHVAGPLVVGGVPMMGNGIPVTSGTTFFVDYTLGSDGNSGLSVDAPFKTIAKAYAMATTNKWDVIVLMGNAAHVLTEMLTVSKSRIIFVGLDGGGHKCQQGARVYMGVTGVATDLAPILVTGTRNSFFNMKVENASTTNESLYGFIDNGEGTVIRNCHLLKTAGLNDANHAHFWMAGDSLSMEDCTIGQCNTPNTAAGFGILIDAKSGGSDTVKENYLKNIHINISCGGSVQATTCFIKIADSAAMNFSNTIENMVATNFIPVAGTIMTDAVLSTALTSGALHLVNPSFFGCTGVGAGSGEGVWIAAGGLAPDGNGGLGTALTD